MPVLQEDINRVVSACSAAGYDAAVCGRTVISRVCGLSEKRARTIQTALRGGTKSPPKSAAAADDGAPKNSREDVMTENAWSIDIVSNRVKNYEELVAECSIDLSVWEPERFKCKSYEVTYVPRATRELDVDGWVRPTTLAVTVPMFALTASFVRKSHKAVQSGDKAAFLKQFKDILVADRSFTFSPRREAFTASVSGAPEIFCAGVSDLHLTEVVRPQDANGVNAYNSVICANRLWDHAQQLKRQVRERQQHANVLKIWTPLLGDITSGTIHPEYLITNDLTDPAAVVLGTRLLTMFFKEIGTLGVPVEISAVHGNHPRLTPKMPTKRQAHTNLDWEVYEFLADALLSDDQFTMDICTAQIGVKELFGWRYLYEHGIGVKDVDGLESRLRDLFDQDVYREATGHTGSSFDMCVIGDRHRPEFRERVIVNGSYIGQNELGQSWRLKPIRAQQLMWSVTEDRVRDWMRAADMTRVKHDLADNPFSEYASWFIERNGK